MRAAPPILGEPGPAAFLTNALTLQEAVHRVLSHNESLQMQVLETEIRRHSYQAERGIFEPQVTASYAHEDNKRQNNIQQQLSLLGTPVLQERNNIYSGGLEFLSPIGSQFKLGYSLKDLENNLGGRLGGNTAAGDRINQWETFIGASVVQPLLKNFGPTATMARIRLAAVASEVAFQDYRRQLMMVVTRAEAAYWDLYLAQEQERISGESTTVAESLLKDSRARLQVGKAADLDVLEAESGLALRRSRLSEARSKRFEGANQLATLLSGPVADTNLNVRAVDLPHAERMTASYFENFEKAFELNPDYLARRKQVEQENIRLAYAKNQRLPQLDLKASYGLNGLGDSPQSAWNRAHETDFPSWTVGVEMRVPVLGGIRERHELEAAKLSKKKALISLKEIEVQISNAIAAALQKLQNGWENIQNNQPVIGYYDRLLKTQLARWDVGKMDSRTLLQTEEKLFLAKVSLADSQVQYEKGLLELNLITGGVLRSRNIDLTKKQLEERTRAVLQQRKWSDRELAKVQADIIKAYRERSLPPGSTPEQAAEWKLQQELNNAPAETEEENLENAQRRAREVLEQKLREKP